MSKRFVLEANIYPIEYRWDGDDDTIFRSHVGVPQSEIPEEFEGAFHDGKLDSQVFYWFNVGDDDEVASMQTGDEIEDGAVLVSIGVPERKTEILER